MHYFTPENIALALSVLEPLTSNSGVARRDGSSHLVRRDYNKLYTVMKEFYGSFDETDDWTLCQINYNELIRTEGNSTTPECRTYVKDYTTLLDEDVDLKKNRFHSSLLDGELDLSFAESNLVGNTYNMCRMNSITELTDAWKACQQSLPNCGAGTENGKKVAAQRARSFQIQWKFCPKIIEAFVEMWTEGYTATITDPVTYLQWEGEATPSMVLSTTTPEPVTITAPARSFPTAELSFTTTYKQPAPEASALTPEDKKKFNVPSGAGSVKSGLFGMAAAVVVGLVGVGLL